MNWTWTLWETYMNICCKFPSDCSYWGVMERLTDHFFTSLYKLIFEQDPPYMSQEAMEVIVDIPDWYASLGGTFIIFYGGEKPPHFFLRYATDKLIMEEVSYHLAIVFSAALHWKKKAPWPTLPLWIILYEIKNRKYVDVEGKEITKFKLPTKDLNPYHPHNNCKYHWMRVHFPWINGAFHWLEEVPWRNCYNASRLNEPLV